MARRGRRPPNAPHPPPAAGKGLGKRNVYTREETQEQLAHVEQAMLQGYRHNAILRAMRERFGVGPSRVQSLEQRVHDHLAEEGRKNSRTAKERAIARAERDLVRTEAMFIEALNQKDAKAQREVIRVRTQLLSHLAMLNGLDQISVEHNVNVSVSGALVGAMASLTPEQASEMVARARERERLAEAYEQEVLGVVAKLPPHANGTAE